MKSYVTLLSLVSAFLASPVLAANDNRVLVEMPPMMQQQMRADMRDHLMTIQQITALLSKQQYEEAADLAENKLGMSSMGRRSQQHKHHKGQNRAQMMPPAMRQMGQGLHRSASQFSREVKDAELDGGLGRAFSALSGVMQQCVGCHSAYRIQ